MRKAALAVVVVGFLALVGIAGRKALRMRQEEGGPGRGRGNAVVPVEIAPVRKATLRDRGFFTGSLLPDSRCVIAPRVGGRLKSLLVNIGDKVERGQSIAVLDDEEFVQQVERARADLAVARATVEECRSNLDTAQREFERAAALREKKIASESEYDLAKAALDVQEARCRVAAAQVDQKGAAQKEAEIRLSYTKVEATWEGGGQVRLIGERFVDGGALLTANSPIVSVIDVGRLIAVVHVIERDYAKIAVGQEAALTTDAFPGRTFTGKIARIAPQLKETSRQARIEISIGNEDSFLKPGMFVRVELEYAEHPDVTAVPVGALARRDGRRGVFVADLSARTARFVPVETGIVSDDLVEIVSPTLDGPVVVMGQHLLEDGAGITVPGTEAGAGGSPERTNE